MKNYNINEAVIKRAINESIYKVLNEDAYQGKDIDSHFKQQQIDGAWKINDKKKRDFRQNMSDKAESNRNKNISDKHSGRNAIKDWDKANNERKGISESQLHKIIKESVQRALREMKTI